MSKIQGKQIADQTLLQRNLALETPLSGDTLSGATVEYVNNYITSLSGATVIGEAEDGTYEDGIFTDFTPDTRIGVAIDRFNEMFLLLAPAPPSTDWTGAFGSTVPTLSTTQLGSGATRPRMIGTATQFNNVLTTQTPSFTISSNVGTGANARTKEGTFVFTLKDFDDSTIETVTIDTNSVTKNTGFLQYTVADPYIGISGQEGFWIGVTSFTAPTFTTQSNVPRGTTAQQLTFEHPDGQTKNSVTFYVDEATHTPVVSGLTIDTAPTMTGNVSGVPTLNGGETFSGIDFAIDDVSTYFYNHQRAYRISGNGIAAADGGFDTNPTTLGEDQQFTGKSVNVTSSPAYNETVSVIVTPYNRINVAGTNQSILFNNATDGYLRIDTVSNESLRLTSGEGQYPSSGWGGTYNSSTSLLTSGNYENELQLLNGIYRYPTVDYSSYSGGPNYSSATGTRYVTFNIGSFSDNSAFTLNITSSGINSIGQADLRIEVQISGQTFWVDGNAEYPGTGNPGSSANGDPAVVVGFPSTATTRRITFGSATYTGAIIVRIGMTQGSNITITSLTATAIV